MIDKLLTNLSEQYKANEVKVSDDSVSFVLPKQSLEEDFDREWHIVNFLKKNGYNVEVTKGDWEYTTKSRLESRSMVSYKGRKAYLRNRYIVNVSM